MYRLKYLLPLLLLFTQSHHHVLANEDRSVAGSHRHGRIRIPNRSKFPGTNFIGKPTQAFRPKTILVDDLVRMRCGAAEIKPTTAKGRKGLKTKTAKTTTKKRRKAGKQSATPAGIFQLIPVSSSPTSSSTAPHVHVKALLYDRLVNWRILSNTILGVLFLFFIRQCLETAGIPRRQAIWPLLVSSGLQPTSTSMPISFQPTPLEKFLAETFSRSSRDMIPPSSMPSGLPFIGALLSCLAWISVSVLIPHWFLPWRVWFDYHLQPKQDQNAKQMKPTAVLIEVAQSASRHSSDSVKKKEKQEVCQLHATRLEAQTKHGMPPFYFEHNNRRYYYNPKTDECWEGGPNLSATAVGELLDQAKTRSSTNETQFSYRGLLHAPSKLAHAQDRWYSYNHQTSVPIPNLRQALWERLKSPLVVIQLIGKVVAVLEDGKQAFLSLGQTVFQHYHNARSIIQSSKTLQKDVAGLAEEFATQKVWIYRACDWKLMEAANLLPGDLFILSNHADPMHGTDHSKIDEKNSKKRKSSEQPLEQPHHSNRIVPVDALVLEGMVVVMEAVLTGESVPQTKMPVDSTMPEWKKELDIMGTHRSSVVFAGTTVLRCMPSRGSGASEQQHNPTLQNGVLCLALRTGSYSSKGELINALTASGAKAGVATISNAQFDQDGLRMIGIMSSLSFLACASLFWRPSAKVSSFRRLIQCTRIATTCIPSDLPLSLSFVVRSCAHVLRQDADVVCSQPGALLTAAEIDTAVFDKTGTLTADTQSLSSIISYPAREAQKPAKKPGRKDPAKHPKRGAEVEQPSMIMMSQLVLAGCHSLVHIEKESKNAEAIKVLVGDPMELAALNWLGWRFSSEGGHYHPPEGKGGGDGGSSSVEKLWQLKVFPFSPRVRLSSALCLARQRNGEYRLWAVVKGAPESVRKLLRQEEGLQGKQFERWYEKRVMRLESKGFRALAMAASEVPPTNATFLTDRAASEQEVIASARNYAATVHRADLEAHDATATFCGLACFNAKIRPSSKRIIQELKAGNVNPIMLTGDSMGAAVAVAAGIGIIKGKCEVAILEVAASDGEKIDPELQWRLTHSRDDKQEKIVRFNKKTVDVILTKNKRGEIALVGSGKAILALFAKTKSRSSQRLLENLWRFSVVARASPDCKEAFVSLLSQSKRVLMCGDGVNDVSAMKEAEVSVALLNGFGTESEQPSGEGKDTEDERRHQRLLNKRRSSLQLAGNRTSGAAASSRIQQRIETAQEKITQRALDRQGINATSSEPIPYSLTDVKDMVSAVMDAAKEERRRTRKLREGGGEAASILLEDEIAMNNGTSKSAVEVRPGEACMASPFSCLRSSIDGVEAVLRAGIATAACTLAIQQKMALNLLLTCFNLSALYRDGFRYGKNMATAEFVLYMIVDQASYRESCRMRPRLPTSKQRIAISLFEPSSLLSIISQTGVHLVLMQVGILFARNVETQCRSQGVSPGRRLIRAASAQAPKASALLEAAIKSNRNAFQEQKNEKATTFLGQPKFVPNYETNVVFALSVVQGTLTTLLMHKGAPFYVSILESPLLCLWSGLSVIFAVACMLETFPLLNSLLELRPWMAKKHQLFVFSLAIMDSLACLIIERCCRQQARKALQSSQLNPGDSNMELLMVHRKPKSAAADLEEQMLREEAKKNVTMVGMFASVVAFMVCEATLRASAIPYM